MKRALYLSAAIFAGSTGFAAALTADDIVNNFSGEGYTRIEVKTGPTQIKVEAIRGGEKLEVVYDRETGEVLKRESDSVRRSDDVSPGVETRVTGRDFVDGARSRDDDDDEHDESDDRDDDDERNDDDGDDDNGGDRDEGDDDDDRGGDEDDDRGGDEDDDRGGDEDDDRGGDEDDDRGGDEDDDRDERD